MLVLKINPRPLEGKRSPVKQSAAVWTQIFQPFEVEMFSFMWSIPQLCDFTSRGFSAILRKVESQSWWVKFEWSVKYFRSKCWSLKSHECFLKNITKLFHCRIMIIKYSIKYHDVKLLKHHWLSCLLMTVCGFYQVKPSQCLGLPAAITWSSLSKWQQLLSPREEVVLEGAKSGEVGGCYLSSNRHPWMAAITAVDLAMSQTYWFTILNYLKQKYIKSYSLQTSFKL